MWCLEQKSDDYPEISTIRLSLEHDSQYTHTHTLGLWLHKRSQNFFDHCLTLRLCLWPGGEKEGRSPLIKPPHDIRPQASIWEHFSLCARGSVCHACESRCVTNHVRPYKVALMSRVCLVRHLCSTMNYTQAPQQQLFTWESFQSP